MHRVWHVSAIDRTARLNAKRPFGTYNNTSATDVVIDLVTRYAPDFTTAHVQTGLARISVVFDGDQDFATCLSLIAQKIGEGHWYVDYEWDVHFFRVPVMNVLSGDLRASPLALGPGTAMVVTASTQPITGSFPPGYYYFRSTTRYRDTPTYPTPPVAAPTDYVLLSNQAAARAVRGDLAIGAYGTITTTFPRGWIGYHLDTTYITTPVLPIAAGDAYFASADVAALLEANALSAFESAFSPISNILLLQHYRPTFASIPIGPTLGSHVPVGGTCTSRGSAISTAPAARARRAISPSMTTRRRPSPRSRRFSTRCRRSRT